MLCEALPGDTTFVERPRVVVELLCKRTARFDIVEKRASYRSLPSLEAYAIVHTEVRRIEIDTRALGGRWQTDVCEDGDVAPLGAGALDVTELYGLAPAT